MRHLLLVPSLLLSMFCLGQSTLTTLSVEKIMRDPKWIGSSPSSPQWSPDGDALYFDWNPDRAPSDSDYLITMKDFNPVKASVRQKQDFVNAASVRYNIARSAYVFSKDGDVFLHNIKTKKTTRVTQTNDAEANAQFSFMDSRIVYSRNQNLYAWDIATGETMQLTNIRTGDAGTRPSPTAKSGNVQEEWLKADQLKYFEVLRARKEKRELGEAYDKSTRQKEMRSIGIEDKILQGLSISPDGRFVTYSLFKSAPNQKTTIVPNYVTESGFTADIPGRTKVGALQGTSEYFLYDRVRDTVFALKADSLPGIRDLPDYVKDYPKQLEELTKKNAVRPVSIFLTSWSPNGKTAVFDARSEDNKDRWLFTWDTATHLIRVLSRQRDEAWIGGPGIFGSNGWINNETYWYQSEETGYSHLYTVNVLTGVKRALTSGNYEVQQARLSFTKEYFFISTNEVHPGELHLYRLWLQGGHKDRVTNMPGSNQTVISPDEKYIAILYSSIDQPWELYVQTNQRSMLKPSQPRRITSNARSAEFSSYKWQVPEVISFTARDGAPVYARVYKPAKPAPGKPAVLFVHGAGYLQNAHKWWSVYYREFMFNNLLAENGYYVMDIDYRGSAGYGRNWRTGIYRHMGGKDLDDNVDAVEYMVKSFGVDPKRVGLYGGSYGGFIALMGLFTQPGVFSAGAALRPVTDWANYNHGYTADILNEPYNDSLAYRRSSPLYFAEGLKGNLLICHGMVDVNVHYQDAVKLTQRLIELGKDNWELASYPMEDHGFVEPSSWTDEYKRIFKLFETVLKK